MSTNSNYSDASDTTSIWLCLHFDQLPLEAFVRDGDEGKPAVVVHNHRVCRLNDAAAALGIAVGNNMDTAFALSEQVVCFERDEGKEAAALRQLAQWAYRFTPNVVIKAPDCLLLEVGGCLKLFKGLETLKRCLLEGVGRLGYKPAIGINTTPLAAVCAARAGAPDNAGGDRDVSTSLAHLPVECLETDDRIIESLQQMGIHTVGNVLDLPSSGLTRRFGTWFTDYLARLRGDKPDPQKYIDPEPLFNGEITFLSDVSNMDSLIFPIKRLLGELEDYLVARQLHVNHLSWTLSHRYHSSRSFSISLSKPESDSRVFLPLTQLKLEQLRDVEEVDSISLDVRRFFPADTTSGDLFHGTRFRQKDGLGGYKDNAHRLLDMLHARLGADTCFGLAIANDHRPEKAWKPVRLGEHRPRPAPGQTEHNPRPAFLLETPKMLTIIDGRPSLGGKLELLKGPERIDFGWWDRPSVSKPVTRDYYVARQKSGALYWIFRYRNGNVDRWYLHGIFS